MLNQDKYKTAEERVKVFTEWCRRKSSCGKCEFHKFTRGCAGGGCEFYWLALEAEEEKPEPCPFCDGETHINLGHLKAGVVHYWVDCISPECMYRSAHYTDKDAAIAAHNRVARAVMAAKESEVRDEY